MSGTQPLGNAGYGVYGVYGVYVRNASDNIIGDAGALNGNSTASNAKGVVVTGNSATNNRIAYNAIHGSTNLAIDLDDNGVTPNDPGDADAGPNHRQNAPVPVNNGLFTVLLDFGANFPGADRWLEIAVRTNGVGGYTLQLPLQALTPTPYAITASNLIRARCRPRN